MNKVGVMYVLMRADALERVRRYSFLVTMGGAVYLGYAAIAGYVQMHVGGYRGVYNSAWIGTLVALTTTMFASIVGFYVVKNTIERDRQTGVGQILAGTPISKFSYVLGKVFSNFVVLASIVIVQAIAALVMQFMKGEDPSVNLWVLFAPFVFIAFPAMAITASLAVLFESVRWLRGGLGNILYFFLWNPYV